MTQCSMQHESDWSIFNVAMVYRQQTALCKSSVGGKMAFGNQATWVVLAHQYSQHSITRQPGAVPASRLLPTALDLLCSAWAPPSAIIPWASKTPYSLSLGL